MKSGISSPHLGHCHVIRYASFHMYSALAGACKYSMRKGADNSNRDLRLGEVLTICEFLGVDPMEFADKEEEKVEGR